MSHTVRQYTRLQDAYDFFNQKLWFGKLPACLITFQRQANARGYFSPDGFKARSGENTTDEIALNPDTFARYTDREILSTLVHEMAHLWQYHDGEPSRTGYHNTEWAEEMERIGLMPSSTEKPGGNRVGQHMTHYIQEGGPFDIACTVFLADDTAIEWGSTQSEPEEKAKSKKASAKSKTKFTCPDCGQNAWAKPGAMLACANVDEHAEKTTVIMIAVVSDSERED